MNSRYQVCNHRLLQARQVPSPNFNERPAGEPVSLLVIHNISLPPGRFGSGHVELFFQNRLPVEADPYYQQIKDLQVSAHLLIERAGAVVQFVDFDKRAWHAGQSCYAGRDNCNDFSIGIELEGTDDTPYTDAQYQTLAGVIAALRQAYPDIDTQALVGHCDIAPQRKTDPGPAFDWALLGKILGGRE
ncbi:1,6-anhydro-N-acetylmuramyl-L-alanine amidase AmpD [Marinobacterium arenosum]|uniref:1,6-anhydro-N-acetylmuramyl-L-alanine amidase AmpD n=1 Tax=Marinobacterium arenosum TaxID=2862496 RepID=UPI001C97ADAF|nr:1,6-anhydro-N-acetylmuramyl-L-alanine amidase AmpD [Marinobacterium arenosum]MBY4676742.1 1,6-anhydro-N-acetylmuramyl-L-alanine amidase AmpD [Marinobacterium arenosum]